MPKSTLKSIYFFKSWGPGQKPLCPTLSMGLNCFYQVFRHRFAEGETGTVMSASFDVGENRDEKFRFDFFGTQNPTVRLAEVFQPICKKWKTKQEWFRPVSRIAPGLV